MIYFTDCFLDKLTSVNVAWWSWFNHIFIVDGTFYTSEMMNIQIQCVHSSKNT